MPKVREPVYDKAWHNTPNPILLVLLLLFWNWDLKNCKHVFSNEPNTSEQEYQQSQNNRNLFFHISEARSQKSRCQHCWLFLEALWEKLPLLPSDGWQQSSIPWVIDTSTSICLHLHVAFFSVSLCPFLSLIGTFIGLRAHSNPVWYHLNIILITSAKTWFPNKVTFWGYTWIIGGTLQSAKRVTTYSSYFTGIL